MDTQSMGNYIREKRESLGMSQEQLAWEVGVSSKTISNWETGKSNIKQENAEKLASVLKVSATSIRMGKDMDGLDKETLQIVDQIVNDLYRVEDRGLLALDMGVSAYGIAMIAFAIACWGASTKEGSVALFCGFVVLFGVGFILISRAVLKKIERQAREKRNRSDK